MITDVRTLAAMVHERLIAASQDVIHVPTESEHLFIVNHGKGRRTMYRLTETTITNDVTWTERVVDKGTSNGKSDQG